MSGYDVNEFRRQLAAEAEAKLRQRIAAIHNQAQVAGHSPESFMVHSIIDLQDELEEQRRKIYRLERDLSTAKGQQTRERNLRQKQEKELKRLQADERFLTTRGLLRTSPHN